MYKALIIDDEKPVRQIIAALGKWKELNIDATFEAVEGRQGLGILREKKPDIVFVDMKMPVMDGVEFLKIATNEFPDVKYIVISGYDDFEYTKQAIKSRVLDYLLKPVAEAELNNTMAKAVRELDSCRRGEREGMYGSAADNVSLPLIKEEIVTSIIQDNISASDVDIFRKYFAHEEGTSVRYGVSIINLINYNEVCRTAFNNDNAAAIFACTSIIDGICGEWSSGFSYKIYSISRELLVVLAVGDKSADLAFVARKIRSILDKLQSLFGMYSVASIGKFTQDVEKLNESYNHASAILNNVNLLSNKECVFTELETETHINRATLIDKKELLIHAFEEGSADYAKKIIREYFAGIEQSKYFSLDYLQKTIMEFTLLIDEIAEYFEIKSYNILPKLRNNSFFSSFARLEDVSRFICGLMDRIYDAVRNNIKANEKANIYKIKEYIDQNYFREIKLTMFSEKFYLSKEYLSKLFKNEFGYSIYEYVLKVRMETAKIMLADSKIKIQSICENVGYNDANYFSKAFKGLFGLSPSEYRDLKLRSYQ